MKKYWIIAAAVGAVAIAVAAFAYNGHSDAPPQDETKSTAKVKVAATFYPLAHFAEQVGKQHVEVKNLTPTGQEPHDYEPTARDIAGLYDAKLLIANGSGLDPWVDKAKSELEANSVTVVIMSDQFDLIHSSDEHEDHEEESHEEEHQESATDPHIWLDPSLAQKQVAIIRDALVKVDPKNEADYHENADRYIAELVRLDKLYSDSLQSCSTRDIVTSHASLGYLAKRYNLNQIPITGLSPEEEPSAQRMAEIATTAKEKNIKYIFFETLVSPKLADTIAKEVGAQTALFNPLEGLSAEEATSGKNYVNVMENNLNSLRLALQCK